MGGSDLDGVLHALLASDVARNGKTLSTGGSDLISGGEDGARKLRVGLGSLGQEDDVGSVLGTSDCNGLSDTSGGSADQDGLALEVTGLLVDLLELLAVLAEM